MPAKKLSRNQQILPSDALVNLAQHTFEYLPSIQEVESVREVLELISLDKVRFSGKITRVGKSDLTLNGKLGATVTQPCSVTLDPVKSRVEAEIERQFVAKMKEPEGESTTEMEINEDIDPMPENVDLLEIAQEVLALNLPPFPRSAAASSESRVFGPPGVAAMTDEQAKPFAGLAELKQKLEE